MVVIVRHAVIIDGVHYVPCEYGEWERAYHIDPSADGFVHSDNGSTYAPEGILVEWKSCPGLPTLYRSTLVHNGQRHGEWSYRASVGG